MSRSGMAVEIMSGMHAWRAQHPKATLRQMEDELDARWARMRMRMVEDMALASAAADWAATPPDQHLPCPDCGHPLHLRGTDTRTLQTHGGQTLTWSGATAPAQPAGPGFSPLDDELALVPGRLTPRLAEALVRLGTHIPSFAKAARELTWFTGATVHADTVRRRTEAAGALLVAQETAEATRILRDHPVPLCALSNDVVN